MNKETLIKLAQSFKNNMDKATLFKLSQPAATLLLALCVLVGAGNVASEIHFPNDMSVYIDGGALSCQ